ncbi:inner centromere protein A-like isoform X2 [Rhinoraja longicauda]
MAGRRGAMVSRPAITMVDTINVLTFFGGKLNAIIEGFKENEIWLKEIQEEAKMMFNSGLNAEPELMPKTPSERKKHRICSSLVQDSNKRFSRSRKSLRRSTVQRIKLRNQVFEEDNNKCTEIVEQTLPAFLTPSASCAAASTSGESETSMSPFVPRNGRFPLVVLSLNDSKDAESHQKDQVASVGQALQNFECVNLLQKADEIRTPPQNGTVLESLTPAAAVLHLDSLNHEQSGLKIKLDATDESTKSSSAHLELSNDPVDEVCISEEDLNKSACNSRRTCRLMRKSIVSRRSSCVRLKDKYLLNIQRATMVQESTKKSLRKSIARRKNSLLTSPSYHGSTEKIKESVKNECSFQHGVESVLGDSGVLDSEDLPPRRTASPSYSAHKVVKPKYKSFLRAVQNKQLLMSPVFVGRTMVKSFINRNTQVKVDPKEKERIHLANLKKKQEQKVERIQKVEEGKKRKLEELKKKRELRQKPVLEACSRVEQQEAKKKNKIEQRRFQPYKSEKLHEEQFAEESAKKKLTVKIGEFQRWHEDDRKQRLLQGEKLQHRRQDELQQQCRLAEAKKLQEQGEFELERKQQHDLHLATAKDWERMEQESFLAEREHQRVAKKRFLQLQQMLEQTTWEEAALQDCPEKEILSKRLKDRELEGPQLEEVESGSLKRQNQREHLEHDQQDENKLEDQEIKWKKEQSRKAAEIASNKNILDKTMECPPKPESYTMSPISYSKVKLPKINLENYGMDLNSDDSTDDEGMPRKPIPAWASGKELKQALIMQFYHPFNLDKLFCAIEPPNLEAIFSKRKPRYLERTSSAVWHSPPGSNIFLDTAYGSVKQ